MRRNEGMRNGRYNEQEVETVGKSGVVGKPRHSVHNGYVLLLCVLCLLRPNLFFATEGLARHGRN